MTAPPGSFCDSLFARPPGGASCLLKMPKASPSCSCPARPRIYSSVSFVSCLGPLPTLGIHLLISSPELRSVVEREESSLPGPPKGPLLRGVQAFLPQNPVLPALGLFQCDWPSCGPRANSRSPPGSATPQRRSGPSAGCVPAPRSTAEATLDVRGPPPGGGAG